MLTEMGIEWFSTGVYLQPDKPLHSFVTRTSMRKVADPKLVEVFKKSNPAYIPIENALVSLPKELVDQFDIIWVTHTFPNIANNWEIIKGKAIIWRTYNQQQVKWEEDAKALVPAGLKVVRIGETEANRITYAGQDAVIRAYVDSNTFCNYKGRKRRVLSFHNRFEQRLRMAANKCPQAYLNLRSTFNCFDLYGFGDPAGGLSLGPLPFKQQVAEYQDNMVYISLNSESAVYTNSFMEALMTGIPVVTFGSQLSNVLRNEELSNTYEVPDLVENEKEAIISDDLDYLHEQITQLLKHKSYRESIGKAGRSRALQLFDKKVIIDQWKAFLKAL